MTRKSVHVAQMECSFLNTFGLQLKESTNKEPEDMELRDRGQLKSYPDEKKFMNFFSLLFLGRALCLCLHNK